jgi:Mn-dependent DtxR family transcriptional regulator
MGPTPAERAVLVHLLTNGDDLPSNIADETEYHRKSIQRAISRLSEDGLVRNKGRGVYTLTEDGRESVQRAVE